MRETPTEVEARVYSLLKSSMNPGPKRRHGIPEISDQPMPDVIIDGDVKDRDPWSMLVATNILFEATIEKD